MTTTITALFAFLVNLYNLIVGMSTRVFEYFSVTRVIGSFQGSLIELFFSAAIVFYLGWVFATWILDIVL